MTVRIVVPSLRLVPTFVLRATPAPLSQGTQGCIVPTRLREEIVSDRDAVQELCVEGSGGFGEAVEHPRSPPLIDHQSRTPQIGKVPGGGGLRDGQDDHQVTHAKRTVAEEMDDAKPGGIRQGTEHRGCPVPRSVSRFSWADIHDGAYTS